MVKVPVKRAAPQRTDPPQIKEALAPLRKVVGKRPPAFRKGAWTMSLECGHTQLTYADLNLVGCLRCKGGRNE